MRDYGFDDQAFSSMVEDEVEFLPILSLEEDEDNTKIEYPETIVVMPLRNTVLFPGIVLPITVGREKSIKAIQNAFRSNKLIGVVAQKDGNIEDPETNQLYTTGVIAKVIKQLKMPDGSTTVIIQGKKRFVINEFTTKEPYLQAKISLLEDKPHPDQHEFEAQISAIRDLANSIVKVSPNIPQEASVVLRNINSPIYLLHFVSSNLQIEVADKQKILEADNLQSRAQLVLNHLTSELQLLELKNKIQNKVRNDMDKQQREYFLNQQLRTIQEELGGSGQDEEIKRYRQRAEDKKWAKHVQEVFDKEIEKLQRLNPNAAEYGVITNYIELLLELPWNEYTTDNFDLKHAQDVLDQDHYSLEKVKDRLIEYLSVLKLKGDLKSPIICLVGPPGVGKTSLGQSVARALGRKYVRMSLGGLHDESEIRGHRKTYIGAMPGRVLQSIKRVKSSNPVFILDEIDKVGTDFRGDPSSALLEVLDPEQNSTFYDNYLEIEYDLSKVLFIATANNINSIQPALRDRMEIIYLSGYSTEEKIEIAKRHLLPKQKSEHGLKPKDIKISDAGLLTIVENYTRESGVRDLDRQIASVMRRIAKYVATNEAYAKTLQPADIIKILGPEKFDKESIFDNMPAGVVVGLAWTPVGGDVLFIETSLSKGKGTLQMTGNLGDVMKESASTALAFIRANADKLGIAGEAFEQSAIHIHVPEGAIPKDGPSAGITMLTALTSAFTGRRVKPFFAMTGEITLRGKVLPVGGIKEKVLAARRAGVKNIIMCANNKKDVAEINPTFIKGVKFHYVESMQEVLDLALEPLKPAKAAKVKRK
ncbi:MAG TPA: endopeptidase La [Chitinophagales bacterium]|nr:endopeptidase La [Chitinophagales bacterium]HNE46542.1 endopeptidase La [Chitinophagales bacterium]HNJ90103.1 endopeptidase La [Chitinophagales bacterium]HNK97685.1 endopeptidase La [Chitinophagales bacterium]HNM09113.1 endopeptidase La [Chitinophagales bacterium]